MKKNYTVDVTKRSTSNLFDKLTKRYSAIGSRIIRKSPGRKNGRETVSGFYDMSGHKSEEFRPEIGLPILISKTLKFDCDSNDNNVVNICKVQTPSPSADSENEAFFDANSSLHNFGEIKFSFLPNEASTSSPVKESNNNNINNCAKNESEDENKRKMHKFKSRSANNLHKGELKLCLPRTPSLDLKDSQLKPIEKPIEIDENEDQYDCPKSMNHQTNIDKRSSEKISLNQSNVILSEINILVSDHHHDHQFMDDESFVRCDGDSTNLSNSLHDEDFDLKSASLQSLDQKNLFNSLDELYAITKEINESDIFIENDINFEYCEHRNNLLPREKRLTLMRNKNNKGLLALDDKKVLISKKWHGFKHWIEEEHDKIKEVVQKHAAMQRVGAKTESIKKLDEIESGENISEDITVDNEDDDELEQQRKTSLTANKQRIDDILKGQNGFEEIRRFVKQGGDFGKELIAILQERTEAEQIYAKSLSKIALKLNKSCRDLPGTIADSWRSVSTEIESRCEIHKQFSNALADEVVKPLKNFLDNQHKSRKAIENNVDKSAKTLTEWRNAELKAKKSSHSAARENEKIQDAMLDVRLHRSPSINLLPSLHKSQEKDTKALEKDNSRLENKRKKAEDSVKRADVEYYTLCVRAERARVEWEISVLRGSTMLQALEHQRLTNFKNHFSTYAKLSAEMNPLLGQIVDRLSPQINICNVAKDLDILKNIRKASEGPSEQLLPDFYCEHTTLAMNRERRKQSLVKLLQLIRQDLERERKSRSSLKGYTKSFENAEINNQNVIDKLYHIRSMLTYLEGARYKLQSALFELDHKPRSSHPLAQHIQINRDRTGLQQSILKVPLWLKNEDNNTECSQHSANKEFVSNPPTPTPTECVDIKNDTLINQVYQKYQSEVEVMDESDTYAAKEGKSTTSAQYGHNSPIWDRGVADGVSNQPDSDFDEFSSQDEDDEKLKKQSNPTVSIGKCRALFDYKPKLYDELQLKPGDIIDIHIKQDDGWWLGAIGTHIGIFPATYVEEIS